MSQAGVDRLVNSEVNTRRIQNVEQCFGSSGQTLNTFGRVLVGEGILLKMCRKGPKQRQFFLFNDVLVYGNILIAKKRYNKQHVIPLEDICLEDLSDDGQLRNGWLVRTPQKSFAVYAANPNEKSNWMMHIDRCIQDLLAKSNKKRPPTLAAVWVPDAEAARCMSCGRTQFSLIQRRHHCRACGNVVCRSCSSHTVRIDSIKKSPVRVCDQCYVKLNSMDYTSAKESARAMPPGAGFNASNALESSSESEDEVDEEDCKPTFYREQTY